MNYNKINNIMGWVICLIACTVYMMTKEATVSFWDCGEFISGAAKMEVVHSPGAPLFLMIGRLFVIILGGIKNAAFAINSLSAISSGFTILFLFWTITHFAKRIVLRTNDEISSSDLLKIMGAGVVGALAYTFSDTFWFSAVEGEVYALSSFLTALVFWMILKWEDRITHTQDIQADRWIVLIAFIMGLSTGVHLLNLLTIPAIVMVYYFKRYEVTTWGTVWAFVIGCVITGFVQYGVIQAIPVLCMNMDIIFVNSFSLPFNSGVLFTIIALGVIMYFLIRWAKAKGHYFVHLGTICVIFILIGYSPYVSTIIRSNADVPIDMTNPDNAITLIKYVQREQYGKVPLLFGPDYNSQAIGMKEGSMQYWKGPKKYEELGEKQDEREYAAGETRFFPRIWDDNQQSHVQYYMNYLGLNEGDRPTGRDNLSFFFGYQVNQMWWRYFCWNYIGRQNDIQNIMGEPQNGNWVSGISFLDKSRVGDMSKMPEAYKNNRAYNKLFFLPFILGLLGFFFHFQHDRRNSFVVGLLFFFTGLAIVIYLNNTPIQPRERDYAYAGATYAFAIWIGLGVMMVSDLLKKIGLGAMSPAIASALCLVAVPILMASQEWDDHDRSQKTLALASARNYLNSCEPNAILFTEGDNDTYPLWYAQEIEGIRTDVRMVNISLLGIDWYIDQLSFAINKAERVPLIWKPEQYRGELRNYMRFIDKGLPQDKYVNLTEALQFAGSEESGAKVRLQGGEEENYFPTKNFSIPVDKELVRKNKIVNDPDSAIVNEVQFTIPENVAYKNDLAILNIIAANAWKRPIYFANSIDPSHYEGLQEYLQLEGLAYKLIPVRTPGSTVNSPRRVNADKCVDLVLNKFEFGNADKTNIFYDQTNRRMMNSPRILAVQLCEYLTANNRKEDAIKVLDKMCNSVSERSFPTIVTPEDKSMILIADGYMKAGATDKAKKLIDKIVKFIEQDIMYKNTLPENKRSAKEDDWRFQIYSLQYLAGSAMNSGMQDTYKMLADKVNVLGQGLPQQQGPQ
ncbi:MAG: DUF2723 domain-containing protein [Chitinophagaceae bacterium]|nr:DUF2723 domain-containing protein [Chitinophagaceae bacterium]